MAKNYPSIFNDVIGPVMRGPSSSHCSAALRLGRMVRDFMSGEITEVIVEFDPRGSLVSTHKSQGSDMGLFAGLLGWEMTDPRMVYASDFIRKAGIKIEFKTALIDINHPNTYKLTIRNQHENHTIIAISKGGGSIEIVELDGFRLRMAGDFYESLVFVHKQAPAIFNFLQKNFPADFIQILRNKEEALIQIKGQQFLPCKMQTELQRRFAIKTIKQMAPVLPVLSRKNLKVPFITCPEMLQYNKNQHLSLWQLAIQYESARGAMPEDKVMHMMLEIVDILERGIQTGLAGTEYQDRILGCQSTHFQKKMQKGVLLESGMLNKIILYTTALMEAKSAMEVIVAAPTAGACGGLPGATIGAAHFLGLSKEDIAHALLAAGLIGIFIAEQATFAAEVAGCQAECGAGSSMAAAALVTLAGGSTQYAVNAASMALQNTLGMICDPVANRVEVPCLGKNVLAASNALACANMALADFDPVIPLDEVIQTMDSVGKMLPSALCCTAKGGLSLTKTSKMIEQKLAQRKSAQ